MSVMSVSWCAISDEKDADRTRFSTKVYNRELVNILHNAIMKLKLDAKVDSSIINAFCADFTGFLPGLRCNRMSK